MPPARTWAEEIQNPQLKIRRSMTRLPPALLSQVTLWLGSIQNPKSKIQNPKLVNWAQLIPTASEVRAFAQTWIV